MTVKTKYLLMLILAINLLLPSGIGVLAEGVAFNPSKIVLLLSVLLIVAIMFSRGKTSFSPHEVDWWVMFFLFGVMTCAFMTGIIYDASIGVALSLSLSALAWCVAYFAIYFLGRLVPTSEYDINWLLKGVLSLLIVGAIIGILEYILKINFYGEFAKLLGLDDIGGVGSILYRGDQFRARSAFDQSIAFGFAMVVGCVLNEKITFKDKSLSRYFIYTIFIVALLVSFSRSAIAAFIVYWFYVTYTKSGKIGKVGIFAIFSICIVLLGSQLGTIFYYDTSMAAGDNNLLTRFRDYEFAGYVLSFSPWFGIGTGILHNATAFENLYPALFPLYDGALDNMALSILVESGIVGLFLYLGVIVGVFRMAARISNYNERRYLVGLALVLLMASVSYDLFIFPGFARLLLLLIALSVSASQLGQVAEVNTQSVNKK